MDHMVISDCTRTVRTIWVHTYVWSGSFVGLTVTAYSDKTVQIDTELMRVLMVFVCDVGAYGIRWALGCPYFERKIHQYKYSQYNEQVN